MIGSLGLLSYAFMGIITVLEFLDSRFWPLIALFFLGTLLSGIVTMNKESTNAPISLLEPRAWFIASIIVLLFWLFIV
jgi:hypothetical protein